MYVFYYYFVSDNAFYIDLTRIPSRFRRNMRCSECYWLVPGTEG